MKQMKTQTYAMQAMLNLFGFGLELDSILGRMTTAASVIHAALLPHVGSLPRDGRGTQTVNDDLVLMAGRTSTFGGNTDYGDMFEGQGYMPICDPDGSGRLPATMSPARYYSLLNDEQRRFFRPEMATATSWPVVELKRKNEDGSVTLDSAGKPVTYWKAVGTSWFLAAEEEDYGAVRLRGELHELAKAGRAIYITFVSRTDPSREVRLRISDWGPAERLNDAKWRFDFDMSPHAYRTLGLSGTRGKDGFYQDHVWIKKIEVL